MVQYGGNRRVETGIRSVIVTSDGFRFEVTHQGNEIAIYEAEDRVWKNGSTVRTYPRTLIHFNHPTTGHIIEIDDKSALHPNPTEKQRREAIKMNIASVAFKGINYQIIR